MITLRPAAERGHFDFGWLKTWHSFSFGDYHDPAWMGFRALRVINEDRIAPGQGFGKHGHRDMEIVTVPLTGALAHEDSSGGRGLLPAGEVQRMSAGTGILHSEFNASRTEPCHLLQIWLLPSERGLRPGWEQKALAPEAARDRFAPVATRDGREGSLTIRSGAELFLARLGPGARVEHAPSAGRHAWIQTMRGALALEAATGGERDRAALSAGDGAAIETPDALTLTAGSDGAEVLLFELD